MLGEVEIIRQVKQAYLAAKERGQTDAEMNMVFQGALRLAKEVVETSQMTHLPVSVGTLACTAALEFGEGKNVLRSSERAGSISRHCRKSSRMSGCNGCITTGDMNIWIGRM